MSDFNDIPVLIELLADEKASRNDPHTVHALETAIATMERVHRLSEAVQAIRSRIPSPAGYGYDKHGNIVPIYMQEAKRQEKGG